MVGESSRWIGEKAAAFGNKAKCDAASTTIKSGGGKMSNGTSALSSIVVVAMTSMTPIAVEFIDSKSNESGVANFLRGPLKTVETKKN